MNEDILCFGFFCEETKIPKEKRKVFKIKDSAHLDKEVKEYIDLALTCAKRSHCDIFVYENDERIKVCLYLMEGVFFGRNKDDFVYLIQNCDEFFIFNDKDKVNSFEIRLCINKID